MSHRKIKKSDFEGKTIKKIDCRAVNFIRFEFTDGTALALEGELVTSYGIAGILACDECAKLDNCEETEDDRQLKLTLGVLHALHEHVLGMEPTTVIIGHITAEHADQALKQALTELS